MGRRPVSKEFTKEDAALLDALGIRPEPVKADRHTPHEERIIAGFEEIQRFARAHGQPPQHGEERDIFERLYAVRLDRIRENADARALIQPMDHQGLLSDAQTSSSLADEEEPDDEALLAALGIKAGGIKAGASPITQLKHVRSTVERKAAEEIANRERCQDFDRFKPLFAQVQRELDTGLRTSRAFERKAEIKKGRFFILGGQKACIAEVGEFFTQEYGDKDARLRVIFDNGTESNMLMRSLQRALHKDKAGRRISEPVAGPLFADDEADGDEASGTIYVLRSLSSLPDVSERRELLHKIGVTGGKVEQRIANARLDPTFLMADVEIIATWELFNINRSKLENLIHRIFEPARLDIKIKDRFGTPVTPREWFLVPLFAINEAVTKIRDGSISDYLYDPQKAAFVRRAPGA